MLLVSDGHPQFLSIQIKSVWEEMLYTTGPANETRGPQRSVTTRGVGTSLDGISTLQKETLFVLLLSLFLSSPGVALF